jgi:signal transduction histidine kinase
MEAQGGSVTARNRDGGGLVVDITVPLTPRHVLARLELAVRC